MLDPTEGWPRYETPSPSGSPILAPRNPRPRPTFEGASPREVFERDGKDPAPIALLVSGATRAPSSEFRMLDGEGRMETSSANLPSGASEIKDRLANRNQHDWRMRVRLGPNADGALSARLKAPPPGLRRAGPPEILRLPSHPGRAGYPAFMDSGASLSFAAMADLSALLAFESRDAQWNPLVRVAGQGTRGHQAIKKTMIAARIWVIAHVVPFPRMWRPRPRTSWGSLTT